jgi:hypothetical protein
MATGLPARVAVLCVLCMAGRGYAQPVTKRPVAVVDLSGDPAASKLRDEIYQALFNHWALRSLTSILIERGLQGQLVDENAGPLADAAAHRAAASDALVEFDLATATTEAKEGQRRLALASPTPAALALYADLSFLYGEALFDQHQLAEAKLAFVLAHHLDPDRKLDPARYLPELRALYDAAKTFDPGTTKLEIKGTGTLVIDGVELGRAPGTFDVAAGHHLVQLVGPDRRTGGMPVYGGHIVEIPDTPLDDAGKLQRARFVLAKSPDPAARASAMRQLAQLLGVHDAVLINKEGDRLRVQTWRDGEQGFSAIRDYHPEKPEKPGELMRPLAAPEPPEPIKPPIVIPRHPIVVEKPWYSRTWVRSSVAGGLVLGIVGAIVWARQTGNVTFMLPVEEDRR